MKGVIYLSNSNQYNAGWLYDVLDCVNKIDNDVFSLDMVYAYEDLLSKKHQNLLEIKLIIDKT